MEYVHWLFHETLLILERWGNIRSDPSSSTRTRHHSGWWYQDTLGRHWYAPLNGAWFCAGVPNTISTWAVSVFWESVCWEPRHPRAMGKVTPLKTEVWKHTHTFTSHTFYPMRPASGCHAVRFCPRTSSRRRMGVTLTPQQRVESRWYNWNVVTRQ